MLKKLLLLTCVAIALNMSAITFNVGDFNELRAIDDIGVNYHCDPLKAGTVELDCDKATANHLMFKNNGNGRLTIQVATEAMGRVKLPVVNIYSSGLNKAENLGDSAMIINDATAAGDCKEFRAMLSDNGSIVINNLHGFPQAFLAIVTGRGKITAQGSQLEKLSLRNLGTGTIDALLLPARDIYNRVVGTGTVKCHVMNGFLSVKGSGSGQVLYRGKPDKVKLLKLGSLKATPLDELPASSE